MSTNFTVQLCACLPYWHCAKAMLARGNNACDMASQGHAAMVCFFVAHSSRGSFCFLVAFALVVCRVPHPLASNPIQLFWRLSPAHSFRQVGSRLQPAGVGPSFVRVHLHLTFEPCAHVIGLDLFAARLQSHFASPSSISQSWHSTTTCGCRTFLDFAQLVGSPWCNLFLPGYVSIGCCVRKSTRLSPSAQS